MSIELLVGIGIVLVLILLGVIFLIPGEKKISKKKRKEQAESLERQKDWEQKALRLEKHVQSLRREILSLKKSARADEKTLTIEKVKVKKFQEKLSQEREWSKKEQNVVDKKGKEFQKLKLELTNVQENFSKGHAANIRFEYQVKDMKKKIDSLNVQRRSFEQENAELKAKGDNSRKEIMQLKKENLQLSKKKEDAQWVAKTEYERVARLLKETEKELARVSRNP